MKARSRDRWCHRGNISSFNSFCESSNMRKKECLWFQENKPLEVVFPRGLLAAKTICVFNYCCFYFEVFSYKAEWFSISELHSFIHLFFPDSAWGSWLKEHLSLQIQTDSMSSNNDNFWTADDESSSRNRNWWYFFLFLFFLPPEPLHCLQSWKTLK